MKQKNFKNIIGAVVLSCSVFAFVPAAFAQSTTMNTSANMSLTRQSNESTDQYKARLQVALTLLQAQVRLKIAQQQNTGNVNTGNTNMMSQKDKAVMHGFNSAADLRVAVNKAMQGHVGLGSKALRDVIDNADSASDSVAALDKNTVAISDLIGSVFGSSARADFIDLWREHIVDFARYAEAIREDNDSLKEDAEDDLEQYAEDIATFLNSAMPMTIQKKTVVAGASEHRDLFFNIMDNWEDNDYDDSMDAQIKAAAQIKGISDLITKGILEKFPAKFQN